MNSSGFSGSAIVINGYELQEERGPEVVSPRNFRLASAVSVALRIMTVPPHLRML